MKKALCFGEIMLRLNPEGYLRFNQANNFMVSYAGGEANVAVSLANFGVNTSFLTKLPDNDIAKSALRALRANNVDVSQIVYGGERVGVYYLEKGASQRPSKVLYDRKYSSISQANREDFNWDMVFKGVDWFHFTGITPPLGSHTAQICMDAVKAAKERGIVVSCDLNYRRALWTPQEAQNIMTRLLSYVNICIMNEEDAEKMLGVITDNTNVSKGQLDTAGYVETARKIVEAYGCDTVAITLRRSFSANDNIWSGMLYQNGTTYFSKDYQIHIVDRVGGGDAFAGGLIYSLMRGYKPQIAIDFAVAASCLKHTIEYDFNHVTVREVEELMDGDTTGRIKR
jgi:2-dehydro-3-deoxygluconokinase